MLDRLLPHRDPTEARSIRRFGAPSEIDYDLLRHDVAAAWLEGMANVSNATSNHARQVRRDCLQGDLAPALTPRPMPSDYETSPGPPPSTPR